MNEQLKALVVQCVEKNIIFSGTVGSAYTVQDLFHVTKLQTINTLYQATKKALESLDSDSLFDNKNTTKANLLTLQADTLKEIFAYKQAAEKAAKEAEANRAAKAEKLAKMKDIKAEKELEALKSMSLEDIEKEIEKIS